MAHRSCMRYSARLDVLATSWTREQVEHTSEADVNANVHADDCH